jgi:hypothetical protein
MSHLIERVDVTYTFCCSIYICIYASVTSRIYSFAMEANVKPIKQSKHFQTKHQMFQQSFCFYNFFDSTEWWFKHQFGKQSDSFSGQRFVCLLEEKI